MNNNKSLKILEALASGYSPITGETLKNESVLNEREVIRALQCTINQLKSNIKEPNDTTSKTVHSFITNDDIEVAVELFQKTSLLPSSNHLAQFFLKSDFFENVFLNSHELYGKYKGYYTKRKVAAACRNYLINNGYTIQGIKNPSQFDLSIS